MTRLWLHALMLVALQRPSLAQTGGPAPRLPPGDRIRIAEARRLVDSLGNQVWPGLAGTPMPVLLVTDSAELLVDKQVDHPVWARPRSLPPTLVATFPVDGAPTIVVGTAERTGKTSAEWALTLVHEHFHQWQYSRPDYYAGVARLDLHRGDTTGMWMLNYPFPYDSAPVARAVRRWAAALRGALEQPRIGPKQLQEVLRARDALRDRLSPADYRYLEFQLWQEGVARYVEYRTAQLAAVRGGPVAEFAALPDSRSYRSIARGKERELPGELERMDLRRDRRVCFYPLGAAIALLLDRTRPEWKTFYGQHPYALAVLLGR
jgi:hypothetical protein